MGAGCEQAIARKNETSTDGNVIEIQNPDDRPM
jgi:hypothetical protein